jgi:hypothetical protein
VIAGQERGARDIGFLNGLLDATEVRVRRPAAHKAGRQRFVSGKARTNTVKALVRFSHQL